MDAHALKQAVAKEAINRVESHQGNDIILGIGTGKHGRVLHRRVAEITRQNKDHGLKL